MLSETWYGPGGISSALHELVHLLMIMIIGKGHWDKDHV